MLDRVSDIALGHLDGAFRYVLCVPRLNVRMRIFCLWPLFMALKSLAVARGNDNLVSGREPVKITRRDVRNIIRLTSLCALSDTALRFLYRRFRSEIVGRGRG